jgi:hypothetical protein
LEASSCQCFIDLGYHLMREESHHNTDLPSPLPPTPPILSLAQLFPPRSAARNYGTNLALFVLLEVAPSNSILYYTLIFTKCSSSLIRTLIPTFRNNRDCFYTQHLRLRWSRGSVLAFGTQVRGFAPGRSRRIVRAKKNPQHTFLRRASKAVGPTS